MAVVLAIAGIAVAAWAVTNDGDSSNAGGTVGDTGEAGAVDEDVRSPEETVSMFFEAVFPPDCDVLLGLVSQDFLAGAGDTRDEQVAACEEQIVDPIPLEFLVERIEPVSENGDRAVVAVTAAGINGTVTEEVDLVMEDGEWKIDFSTGSVVDTPSNDLEDFDPGA